MDLSAATGWWVVAGLLVVAELSVGSFYLLMLALGGVAGAVAPTLLDGVFGIIAGGVVLAVVALVGKVWPKKQAAAG